MFNQILFQSKTDSTGDIQALSGYVVVLRESPFTTNTIIGSEVDGKPGYYLFKGIEYGVAYRKYVGTSLSTLSMDESFSNEDGKVLAVIPDDSVVLDPEDFPDELPYVKAAGTVGSRYFTGGAGGGVATSVGGDYYFLRGMLCQENTIYSGRAFFGSISLDTETGLLIGAGSSTYTGDNAITIADSVSRNSSAKVSTGIYSLQCKTDNANGFIDEINNAAYFEDFVMPVYGVNTSRLAHSGDFLTIRQIQRFSATHIRIKLNTNSGVVYTNVFQAGFVYDLQDLAGSDISPLPDGEYTVSSSVNDTVLGDGSGYVDFLCNSDSGTGTFSTVSGGTLERVLQDEYENYRQSLLAGYVVLDVNYQPLTYFGTGKLIVKTYNENWELADDIINRGVQLTFKAFIVS